MAGSRPVVVISDLHLGDRGPRDSFAVGDREKQLTLFLDFVDQQQGELVVLGDLFEFWQMNVSAGGTWARKVNSFLRIGPAGEVSVFDWVNGQAVPNDTVLEA